jgi:peptidyl-prolyl cis-trans isomerase B (cyclophilin B)
MSRIAFIEDGKKASMFKILFFLLISIILIPVTQSFAQLDDKVVIFDTKSGRLVIEFFPNDAPKHVENFINLTESGFYDRTIFHRVIGGFMIQGGDPLTKPGAYELTSQWGTGDPGYKIDAEFNDIKHNRGILSMARSADPNSAGSQFFIVHKDSNFLDGQYTVFGRIVTQESFETLDKIATLETTANDIPLEWGEGEILKSEVVKRSTIPDLLQLDVPERVSESISPEVPDSKYSNEELKFSASFPVGWFIQEPEQTVPGTPDVVAVGPLTNGFNPTISISMRSSDGQSLDEHIEDTKNVLKAAIDSGQLSILSEEKTTIKGKNSYIMTSDSFFNTTSGVFHIKFREVIIETPDKFFSITYANTESNFDNNLQFFENTLDSFEDLSENSKPENGGGCLIATTTFGSEQALQVQQLRETRDNVLMNTESGKSFLSSFNQLYYTFSPTIADWERQNPIFKEVVGLIITPLLTTLSILNYVDIDSEAEMVGYGVGVILLNIGIYFVGPAIIIHKLKRTEI